MAAAADNILANLPRVFAKVPRPNVLGAMAEAFGGELTRAENSLAAMMFAHWVDVADKDSDARTDLAHTDLAKIAALYGLAPRDDESIEGFRDHLKRHVRTFLEGTVTTKGVLRIVAESLAMVIADDDQQLDTWWSRQPTSALTELVPSGDDAATLLFGVSSASVRGTDSQPAEFVGIVDLSHPVDLRGQNLLQLAVDSGAPVTIDLATDLNLAAADIDSIVTALSKVPGIKAEAVNGNLVLRSATAGPSSSLVLGDTAGDASQALLGIAPHLYFGTAETRAQIVGAIDLPATLDLTTRRYLRISVNGNQYEIDCAAAGTASAITPDQIVAAIAAQVAAGTASIQNKRLVLSSPTPGLAGTVGLLVPTTGDATRLLFGDISAFARGSDKAPARVTGMVDLKAGIDLSQRSVLKLAVDGAPPVVVLCGGVDPTKTLAGEISTAINAAFGRRVATQNGRAITLTSQKSGPDGSIQFLTAPAKDALDLIFGFVPRNAIGTDSSPAIITGTPDLGPKVDLNALQRLQITVDDGPATIIDLASIAVAGSGTDPSAIVTALNQTLGASIASTDGHHLTLRSGVQGMKSALALSPIETLRARQFVSRAFSTDEAANIVLGFFSAEAVGSAGASAVLIGDTDLHDGLDLRVTRFLRVALDGGPPIDIDCARASTRARVVLLSDIVQAINTRLGHPIATIGNGNLILTSTTSDAGSAVNVLPNAGDGTQVIFGRGPGSVAGTDAQRLVFTGLVDLSRGVDLSTGGHIRLSIDSGAPVDIDCTGGTPAQTRPASIVSAINGALAGSYASTDGTYLRVSSSAHGAASKIAFLAPAAADATRKIFGIDPGRTYIGNEAAPATLTGRDLPATVDLSATPFIRISSDSGANVLVDCRGANAGQTTPAEIAARIDAAFPAPKAASAAVNGTRVVVTAKSTGASSAITLAAAGDGDASALLIGKTTSAKGVGATGATLTGTVDLRSPVDLSTRPILRVAVDGNRPVDIDVSGAAPDRTVGDDIASAINAELPGSATIDASGHLILQSPTTGPASHIEVLPLRALELIEYPEIPASWGPLPVKTGQMIELTNSGPAKTSVSFDVWSEHGMSGVELINLTSGYRIHFEAVIELDQILRISASGGRITAALIDAITGGVSPTDSSQVIATPQMLSAVVPFHGFRHLGTRRPGEESALALVETIANNVVVITSGSYKHPGVSVTEADAAASSSPPASSGGKLELLGRLKVAGKTAMLLDSTGATIANVRAGGAVSLADFDDRLVCAVGTWYPDASLLSAEVIARLFDVEIGAVKFPAVTLDPRIADRSLTAQISAMKPRLVSATDFTPADALALPTGKTEWTLTQCYDARFNSARFNAAEFAGGLCNEPGIFDLSRFNQSGDDEPAHRDQALARGLTRFAPLPDIPPVMVTARWQSHQPGAFTVNLPADLPPQFGARFNNAHFGTGAAASEIFSGLVLEPPDDPHSPASDYIVNALPNTPGAGSTLVYAQAVAAVPIGWEGQSVPFGPPRRRFLSGGKAGRPAAVYLQEHGVPGAIGILARQNGPQGNDISISVGYAGPGVFDLTVNFAAASFESARAIAYAGSVKGQTEPPAPIGVVQAKAAGIQAAVTRERT